MREKGVGNLLQAWSQICDREHRLIVIGDGPERMSLEKRYGSNGNVVFRGSIAHKHVLEEIGRSRFLVLPSLVYEGMPMAVLEAFCLGTPVIVPDHGPFPDLVTHGEDGFSYSSDDPVANLGNALKSAISASEQEWQLWSASGRRKYSNRFNAPANYQQLMRVYEHAFRRDRQNAQYVTPDSEVPLLNNNVGSGSV
jgi:glycosyltransferase involved in cell wall biosynthesis